MTPTFSLLINHAPWAHARKPTLDRMVEQLVPQPDDGRIPWYVHDVDYRGGGPNPKTGPVLFTISQWAWAAKHNVTHHVFMTDDLALAPNFWRILEAMVMAVPSQVIGLLSNHPAATALAASGNRWYRTNSWVVGPCYVVPHAFIQPLLEWEGRRFLDGKVPGLGWSDDSELNEWITFEGPHEAWHPIPTPIVHKREPSTWAHTGHGDDYSHERVAWNDPKLWMPEETEMRICSMMTTAFWSVTEAAPMLGLP